MSRFWRAALTAAIAAGAAAVAWHHVMRWSQIALQTGERPVGADLVRPRTREDFVDELSEDQKEELLSEFGAQF